jgi:hypothetical protein
MTEAEEQAYVEGSRIAWRRILMEAIKNLGRDTPEWTEKRWLLEREEAISTLRRVCREFGDNDWPDDLNLSDIVEKHLTDHLERS